MHEIHKLRDKKSGKFPKEQPDVIGQEYISRKCLIFGLFPSLASLEPPPPPGRPYYPTDEVGKLRRPKRESITSGDASIFEGGLLPSMDSLPTLQGLFSMNGNNLSQNFRKIQTNFVKELNNFQLPGLPTVGELRESLTSDSQSNENSTNKGFLDSIPTIPEVITKSRRDFARFLPSSFRITENQLPSFLNIFPAATKSPRLRSADASSYSLEKSFESVLLPNCTETSSSTLLADTTTQIGTTAADVAVDFEDSVETVAAGQDTLEEKVDIEVPVPPELVRNATSSAETVEVETQKENQVKPQKAYRFSLQSLMNSSFQSMLNQSMNIPLIKQFTEDVSKVTEIIKERSQQITRRGFNQKIRSELENLHFTNHVKNASEEIKKFRLPGLPSIGELLNNSLNISSRLPDLPSLISPLNVLRSLSLRPQYGKEGLPRIDEDGEGAEGGEGTEDESRPNQKKGHEELLTLVQTNTTAIESRSSELSGGYSTGPDLGENLSLEESFMNGIKSLVDNSLIHLRYSIDEASKVFSSQSGENLTAFDPGLAVKNLSISLLQGLDALPVPAALEGLVNPEVDVDNIERVLRILPHMLPYIMQDYKERLHGLVVGTRITQEQLFEIHSSLVDWHNKIESVRKDLPGGEIHRVLGILQEHNLVLMSLLINLMTEAGEAGEVGLSHHHLKVIDRHLIKAGDVFPGLKHIL